MTRDKHIRIKNNLYLVEDGNLLSFQKSYSEGVEFPVHEISEIIITALNKYSLYDDVVDYVISKTSWPRANADLIITKWFEMGLIECFDLKTSVNEISDRYDRQIGFFDALLPLEDYKDNIRRQEKLQSVHILIIGIGGIGNYAALSFAAMGIGKITLVDGDKIERSNLSRQVIFNDSSIDRYKTEIAARELKQKNPSLLVNHFPTHLNSKAELEEILKKTEPVDYVFVSADKPLLMPYWVDELAIEYGFSFINCSYQSYTGFVGPLITPTGKRYHEIVKKEKQILEDPSGYVADVNKNFRHPSMSPTNAIIANMAVLESIKHLIQLGDVNVLETRAVFNLKTFEITYENEK